MTASVANTLQQWTTPQLEVLDEGLGDVQAGGGVLFDGILAATTTTSGTILN